MAKKKKNKNNQQLYLVVMSISYNNDHYGNMFSKEKSGHLYPGDSQQPEDSIYSPTLGGSLLLVLKLTNYPWQLRKIYYCHAPKSE